MPSSRRDFLAGLSAPAAVFLLPRFGGGGVDAAALCAELAADDRDPAVKARDESYWATVARAFTCDRSMVNLNNGGVSPAPDFVQQAMERHLRFSNQAPAYHMWRLLEPGREGVRQRLARTFGADPEEIAITRNASESLQICQLGFDFAPGDQVLTTDQDYPRMLTTFEQRARREQIELVKIAIPTPCEDDDEIVRRYAAAITDRTKLILVSHVVFLTGQILPVAKVVALGRARGIPVVVDGAHAIAHFEFQLRDLDCDYYGASLHKWLFAPHGTGLLLVRKPKIRALWPLMAAAQTQEDDIRKFEEIGTHPAANALAIAEALTFHESIGARTKQLRLIHLRDLWAKRLAAHDRVRLHTSLKPGFAAGIATFSVDGIEPETLVAALWDKHRIFTVAVKHAQFRGVRVSPSVYTAPQEIERFCAAVEQELA